MNEDWERAIRTRVAESMASCRLCKATYRMYGRKSVITEHSLDRTLGIEPPQTEA